MRTRRLPDTDLARIAPLPTDMKRKALRQMKGGGVSVSYDPVRAATLDILNAQQPMFESLLDTPLEAVEARIRMASKSLGEEDMNLGVARPFYAFVRENNIRATHRDLGRFGTRIGDSVAYWFNAVLVKDGALLIPLPDYRRTYRFTPDALKFATSVMHERVRVQDPYELGTAKLALFNFPSIVDSDERSARLTIVPDDDLFSADQLSAMLAETYQLWDEIQDERPAEPKKSASGGLF